MSQARLTVPRLLDTLEEFHGPQKSTWPVDPYQFLIWWYCGYPASDAACAKGWSKLTSQIGLEPETLLATSQQKLAAALKPGGMVPALRALRVKEVALRVTRNYGGNLRAALSGPLAEARKILKQFASIADPGADRILLFAGIAPIAAIPSNCVHVPVRILDGRERENYAVNYRRAQQAIEQQVPQEFAARQRAYLLLKRHGQEICKRTKPKCGECPVNRRCAFFIGYSGGGAAGPC